MKPKPRLGWFITASSMLLAGCGVPSEPAQHVAPVVKRPTTRPPSTDIAQLTRYYADLMAHQTRLTTSASRQGASPIAGSDPEDHSFSRTLPACEVVFSLNQRQQILHVEMASPRVPRDPNSLAIDPPRQPPRLVRLGELRRVFGRGAEAPDPSNSFHEYDFRYSPATGSKRVTIRATVPAFVYADSAMVDGILIYLPD